MFKIGNGPKDLNNKSVNVAIFYVASKKKKKQSTNNSIQRYNMVPNDQYD